MGIIATKAQQQTAVGEGLALGAIMLGIEEVNGNKGTLELDFRSAWRDWKCAALFPAVKADFSRDDLFHVLGDSLRRRGPIVAHWEGSWPFIPVLRVDDWSADEGAEIVDDRVPAHAWAELVRAWLLTAVTS